jgi:hypothetical protein
VANHDQLIGTNVGPLVVPWAVSGHHDLRRARRARRAAGLRIDWKRYMPASAVVAVLTLPGPFYWTTRVLTNFR